MQKIRIGGQAFGDGVLMRSKKHWSLVREDGSVEFGEIHSLLDRYPRLNIVFVRSLISLFEMFTFALKTYRNNSAAANIRLFGWLGIYLLISVPLSLLSGYYLGNNFFVNIAMQLVYLVLAIWTMTRGMSNRIWTYHGAEHKAVNAYEQDINLEDVKGIQSCSRIHPRCGTNLVFLVLLLTTVSFSMPAIDVATPIVGFQIVAVFALSLEIFRLLMRWPKFILTRVLMYGGHFLQRFLTTREPDNDQVVVASKAIQLVLTLDAMKP